MERSRKTGWLHTRAALSLICSSLLVVFPAEGGSKDKSPQGVWESGKHYSVKSTGLRSIRYEHKSLTLAVERSSGVVHEYYNVPRSMFTKLMDTRFKTGVLGAYIESRYKRKQVTVTAPASE